MDSYSLLNLKKLQPNFKVIIPFLGHMDELSQELTMNSINVIFQSEAVFITQDLVVNSAEQKNLEPIWAQDIWHNCTATEIHSINQGVDLLKKYKNIGSYYPMVKSNFGDLIAKKVKNLPLKRIKYQPSHPFDFKFTAWTILDNLLITSENTKQRFPFGWHEFEEDKNSPPNRAYLKLWEVFTVHGIAPQKQDEVIEVGSSPGGWTWVLSQLTKKVYSIDKAPLADKIAKIDNIVHQEKDAFKLNPQDYANCTWFFSDIICTPEKIYETIQFWMANSQIENFICTIKFKGNCNFDILKKFAAIENSKLIHLYHNKNEVTWIKTKSTATLMSTGVKVPKEVKHA